MRHKFGYQVEASRITKGEFASNPGDRFGAFRFAFAQNRVAVCIVTDGAHTDWEHVSCHVKTRRGNGKKWTERTPSWDEMCLIKSLFWDDDECVIQFHPAKADYVNTHKHVLHLWKNKVFLYETPPQEFV